MRPTVLAVLLAFACESKKAPAPEATPAETPERVPEAPAAPTSDEAHAVVFSDRASQTYLLLVPESAAKKPTRPELVALVRRELTDGPEVDKLVELVERDPIPPQALALDEAEASRLRKLDLLGLSIDTVALDAKDGAAIVPREHLREDVLVRALTEPERASLPTRTHALLLHAEYRNREAVRGLRLLQTLVRLVATERSALIYDPDTQETVGVEVFTERRLRSGSGNVADQIVVVPFPDARHGGDLVRLCTRGMRRFGSVDLELDGLPSSPGVLQVATHFLQGLAYRMVREGQMDPSGLAASVPSVLEVRLDDVRHAYASRGVEIPACRDCPQAVDVHLVERPSEPHDPLDHVVARVVAPREVSDGADYDHPRWTQQAIALLFGDPDG